MREIEAWYVEKYPGAPTHTCDEPFCRARAWIGVGGEDAITRTLEETIREIRLRTPPFPTLPER